MKAHDPPMVTITQEHYNQLLECKNIVEVLWRKFGPHSWPREFSLPAGRTLSDIASDVHEFAFYTIRSRFDSLFDYDDSE